MTTAMKSLLKGLRYISHIFEGEKEQEMQIGFPTDVKHVAHIGWEAHSANKPSWMNEFKSPELTTEPYSSKGGLNQRNGVGTNDSLHANKIGHKSRRKSSTATDSPTKLGSSEAAKRCRHNTARKHQSSTSGSELPSQNDQPEIPKHSRQRKSKGYTGGVSSTG